MSEEEVCIQKGDGTLEWFWKGKRGRKDDSLPSILWGSQYFTCPFRAEKKYFGKEFWKDGERHRGQGLPAVEFENGLRMYFEHGLKHNDNGPAVVYPDGEMEWWLQGVFQKRKLGALKFEIEWDHTPQDFYGKLVDWRTSIYEYIQIFKGKFYKRKI
jgi:hypothetical protein